MTAVAERVCVNCGGSMQGKKSSALSCSVACNHAVLFARRKAAKWEGVDPDRPCAQCGVSLTGRRPHAVYCSRVCKAASSSVRRETDGRGHIKANGRRAKTRRYIPAKEIKRLLNRQRHICYYCPKSIAQAYDLDHVVPLSRGGTHSIGNLVAACPRCNRSKRDKFIIEWRIASGRGGR